MGRPRKEDNNLGAMATAEPEPEPGTMGQPEAPIEVYDDSVTAEVKIDEAPSMIGKGYKKYEIIEKPTKVLIKGVPNILNAEFVRGVQLIRRGVREVFEAFTTENGKRIDLLEQKSDIVGRRYSKEVWDMIIRTWFEWIKYSVENKKPHHITDEMALISLSFPDLCINLSRNEEYKQAAALIEWQNRAISKDRNVSDHERVQGWLKMNGIVFEQK